MLNSGMLSQNDLYWKEGNTGWESVGSAFHRTTPPPIAYSERTPGPQMNLAAAHPGFWLRVAAYFIDQILISIAGFIAGFVFALVMAGLGGTDQKIIEGIVPIVGIVVSWLYYALFESSPKQATPGKLVCGFVVTDMNGNRISFGRATGRYFGHIISALTLCIGYIMCAFTEKKQCLHDMMARCLMYKKNG
jgi:uncharacterized RDD family membrane protein YckC